MHMHAYARMQANEERKDGQVMQLLMTYDRPTLKAKAAHAEPESGVTPLMLAAFYGFPQVRACACCACACCVCMYVCE